MPTTSLHVYGCYFQIAFLKGPLLGTSEDVKPLQCSMYWSVKKLGVHQTPHEGVVGVVISCHDTHTHTQVRMCTGNHIERLHSKLRYLSYESHWGHNRPSHNSDQTFEVVYKLIHGLTVRHIYIPHPSSMHSTFPPLPSPSHLRKNHSAIRGLESTSICKLNSHPLQADSLKKLKSLYYNIFIAFFLLF